MEQENDQFFGEPISVYSRQQAIEDGVLVDVSDTKEAKEAGFKIPVCLTIGVYELVKAPEGLEGLQDFTGRLWDVLYMATFYFKIARRKHGADPEAPNPSLVEYPVIFQVSRTKQATVKLWLCFNEYEGFTIMKPEEY